MDWEGWEVGKLLCRWSPEINSFGHFVPDLLSHCKRQGKAQQWYVYSAEYFCSVQTIQSEFKGVPYSEYITTTDFNCIT